MSSSNLLTFNDQNFASEVLQSPVPVLVDFTAVWCGPAKELIPILGKIADDYAGQVRVGTLDIDEPPDIAQRYGERSVPTCMAFRGGQKTGQEVGLPSREELLELLGLD